MKASTELIAAVTNTETETGIMQTLVNHLEQSVNIQQFTERFREISNYSGKFDGLVRGLRLKYAVKLQTALIKAGTKKKDVAAKVGETMSVSAEMGRHYVTAALISEQHNIPYEEITDVVKFAKQYTPELNQFGDKLTNKDGFPIYVKKPEKVEPTTAQKIANLKSKITDMQAKIIDLQSDLAKLEKLHNEEKTGQEPEPEHEPEPLEFLN